jgi:hypothetical protein
MFRFASMYRLALAVAILASASLSLAADQVPFKGSFKGTVTRSLPPPPITVNVEANGNATHLGRFSLEIPHTVIPPNGNGTYHFIAANGDRLDAEFEGLSEVVAPGFLYIVEWVTITGGTGRFADASGSFVTERMYDTAAGTTIGSFEGTISRPSQK